MNSSADWLWPWWDAIGWTMLHFLWIGAVIGFVSALLRWAVRRRDPETRYAVSLVLFAILALVPACLFAWTVGHPSTARVTTGDEGRPARALSVEIATRHPHASRNAVRNHLPHARRRIIAGRAASYAALDSQPPNEPVSWAERIQRQLPNSFAVASEAVFHALPWLWIAGFPLTCLWLLTGVAGAERLRRRSQPVDDERWLQLCRRLQRLLHVSGNVALGVSDRVAAPILVGIVRPMILLPAAALTGLPSEQIEMILLHELAHIRRWDNFVNLLQRLVEAVLFFHPAVWWLSNRVRLEREHCCDAVVLAHIGSPQSYAELLAHLAIPDFGLPPALGMSATHQLAAHIQHILKQEDQPMQVSRRVLTLICGLLISLVVLAVTRANKETSQTVSRRVGLAATAGPHAVVSLAARSNPQPDAAKAQHQVVENNDDKLPSISPKRLRFDGLTFDQWRGRLMTELKPELRAEAITALGRLGQDGNAAESVAAIGKCLRSAKLIQGDEGDQKIERAAESAILRIGVPAVPFWTDLLKNAASPEVRRFAAENLGQLPWRQLSTDRSAVDALVQATREPDLSVRERALTSLQSATGRNTDKSILVQTAIERLKDDDPRIRQESANILGNLGRPAAPAIPALLAALKDPRNKGYEVTRPIGALIQVGTPSELVVPALIDLLRDTPDDLGGHDAIFDAFGRLGPAAGKAVPALIDAFTRAEHADFAAVGGDRGEQTRIVVALVRIGPDASQALPVLEQALRNLRDETKSGRTLAKALREAIGKIKANKH
jgi:beta-lactamase regulating signal transducer with metallopeptidase domain